MNILVHDRIADMQPDERPRERLAARGVGALSDIELLALMLGTGGGGRGVGRLALDLLNVLDAGKEIPDIDALTAIPGVGPARASLIAGSLEFARRRLRPASRRITHPRDVLPLISHWLDRPQEHFLVLSLNGAHEVLRLRVISQGILDRTLVHPREVFADPLAERAAAIICAHNHPSGCPEPSNEDRDLTMRLRESGDLLGIPLLDHIIFSESGYYSFLETEDAGLNRGMGFW